MQPNYTVQSDTLQAWFNVPSVNEQVSHSFNVLSARLSTIRGAASTVVGFLFAPTTMQGTTAAAAGTPIRTAHHSLLIRDLGWTLEDVREVRSGLEAFADDWNAPGMEAYDAL